MISHYLLCKIIIINLFFSNNDDNNYLCNHSNIFTKINILNLKYSLQLMFYLTKLILLIFVKMIILMLIIE